MKKYQLVVIGGGPAGLAAAVTAWNAGLRSVLVIERGSRLGGILNQCIHNGFGLHYFKEELTGPEYALHFIKMLEETGVEVMTDTMVLGLDKDKKIYVSGMETGYQCIEAESIVLAMGCRERARGAVGIPGDRPSGVFTAGTAQQYMNLMGKSVGKKVVIRGTGDIGLIMARRITLEGGQVLACIGASDHADGLTRNVVQCLEDYDIPLLLRHTVTEVRGKDRLEQVVVMEVDEKRNTVPGTEKVFDCDTLLLSIGLIPENELSRQAGIDMDRRTNGAVVYENMETSIPGVFACGNVVQVHDLVDYVTGESIRAGKAAAEYVLGAAVEEGEVLSLANGDKVGYTVPMKIRKANVKGNVEVFFRVKKVFGKSAIVVTQGDKQIARYRRSYMLPSEMEKIILPKKILDNLSAADGEIRVSAVEEEG